MQTNDSKKLVIRTITSSGLFFAIICGMAVSIYALRFGAMWAMLAWVVSAFLMSPFAGVQSLVFDAEQRRFFRDVKWMLFLHARHISYSFDEIADVQISTDEYSSHAVVKLKNGATIYAKHGRLKTAIAACESIAAITGNTESTPGIWNRESPKDDGDKVPTG